MSSSKRLRRKAVWALTGLSVAALGSAVAAFGYYTLDWGCPSNAETERPRATEEVVEAFAKDGLNLQPLRLPIALPLGAQAYRHATEDETLFVVVCERICNGEGPDRLPDLTNVDFAVDAGPPQRMRSGIDFLNVAIWATEADRRSARRLINSVHPIVNGLDRIPPPDDRCYVR